MNRDRFLTLFAAATGFLGSCFLASGGLGLTPDIAARLAESDWGFNPAQVNSLAAQKANVTCGAFLILLALLITVVRLAFLREEVRLFISRRKGMAVAFTVSAILLVIFLFVRSNILALQRREIGLAITGRTIDRIIKKGKVEPVYVEDLRETTERLLAINPDEWQDDKRFFEHIVGLTGRRLPSNFDLSRLKESTPPTP